MRDAIMGCRVRMPAGRAGRAIWYVLALVVVAIAVVIVLATRHKGPDQYQVGVILPLSGNLAYVGQMEADGMKLAAEDINAKGGVNGAKLVLRFDDSQGKADIGVTAAQKMMSVDNIRVIMASISSVVLGLKPVVEQNGGILIGLNMHSTFFRDSPNVFRFYEGAEQESRALAEYLTSLKGASPRPVIGALYADVPNAKEQVFDQIQPALRKAGMDFAVTEPYALTDKEFRDKVLRLRAAGITHLLLLGYGFEYPAVFQSLKEQRMLPGLQIVGGWGFLYPKLPAADLEGVVVAGPSYVFEQPEPVRDFYRRFREKFGYEANFDAAMTYAAVELLAAGLRRGHIDKGAELSAALTGLRNIATLIGRTTVGVQGDSQFDVGVGRVQSGALIRLRPSNR